MDRDAFLAAVQRRLIEKTAPRRQKQLQELARRKRVNEMAGITVIGIDTLVAGQAQGIGFAIAINTAKPIADQLVATGKAAHPVLGISYTLLTPSIAAQLGVSAQAGVVVVQLDPNGPAAKAGLRRYDVITAVDGQRLQGDSALAEVLNRHRPGDTLALSVLRGTQTLSLPVTLGESPAT